VATVPPVTRPTRRRLPLERPSLRERLARYALATTAPRPGHGFHSSWTLVDGVRVHARAATQQGRGSAVVLVHGLAVSHRYLMPTAQLLAAHHDVYVVDLPGFGLSADPGPALDVPEHAAALAGWLEANQIGPAVLLGNSFGCQVLVELVSREPERCTALILSGPTIDPHARTASRQIARGLRDLLREDPLQVLVLARDVLDAGPARVWATLHAALRDPIETKLPRVTVPTLVLRGALEPVVPARWAREATALIPNARLVELSRSPHNAVYVSAEAVTAAVLRFLSALGPGGRIERWALTESPAAALKAITDVGSPEAVVTMSTNSPPPGAAGVPVRLNPCR
jgi:pimeloyl-ACP methyl ester carboxylesterase